MALALFDLDNTLLNGDSDYLWGRFLARIGIVDGDHYERQNLRFYEQYKQGDLDIHEFLRFSLKPLADNSRERLDELHRRFMKEVIEPILLPAARELLNKHRSQGDTLLIITATNHFVTEPIARAYGVENLIATTPEEKEGEFTGEVSGTPCFQSGKIERLNDWLKTRDHSLEGSYFYSDSHNDLPLLEKVDHPFAVDPDEKLTQRANENGWPIISLR